MAKKTMNYYKLLGYPENILNDAFEKVSNITRDRLLTETTTQADSEEDKFFLTVTYNPANPDLKSLIENHWPIIESSKQLSCLHNKKTVVGYRRNKNLRDLLIRARIRYPPDQQKHKAQTSGRIRQPCEYLNPNLCKVCKKINTTGLCKSTNTGRIYHIPEDDACGSFNLIYLITC